MCSTSILLECGYAMYEMYYVRFIEELFIVEFFHDVFVNRNGFLGGSIL